MNVRKLFKVSSNKTPDMIFQKQGAFVKFLEIAIGQKAGERRYMDKHEKYKKMVECLKRGERRWTERFW